MLHFSIDSFSCFILSHCTFLRQKNTLLTSFAALAFIILPGNLLFGSLKVAFFPITYIRIPQL